MMALIPKRTTGNALMRAGSSALNVWKTKVPLSGSGYKLTSRVIETYSQ